MISICLFYQTLTQNAPFFGEQKKNQFIHQIERHLRIKPFKTIASLKLFYSDNKQMSGKRAATTTPPSSKLNFYCRLISKAAGKSRDNQVKMYAHILNRMQTTKKQKKKIFMNDFCRRTVFYCFQLLFFCLLFIIIPIIVIIIIVVLAVDVFFFLVAVFIFVSLLLIFILNWLTETWLHYISICCL